jgi:hypothetical protein
MKTAIENRAAGDRDLVNSATGTSKISSDTERIGASLYRYASLPFEIASLLLLVAIIGSVMLSARQSRRPPQSVLTQKNCTASKCWKRRACIV